MSYVIKHWHGDVSVAKAVWFGGLIALAVSLPVGAVEMYDFFSANGIHGLGDVMARAEDGSLAALEMPPFLLELLNHIIEPGAFVWWAVGTWRACDKPANNPKGGRGHGSVRLTIVLTALYEIYDLYDFVSMAFAS